MRRALIPVLLIAVHLTQGSVAHADQGVSVPGSGGDAARSEDAASDAALRVDDRAAYAEHLFQDGIKLMKSDNCPQALLKFQSSEQLDPSAATLINIATCYARLGRTATAWRTYREAASVAGREGNDGLRERAFSAISILTPTLTRLKVVPPRGSAAMKLTLNGEPLGDTDDLPIALDPGENIVEASMAGRPPWRRTVNATELGATIVIEVPEAIPRSETTEPRSWSTGRTLAIVSGGVGIVGIVTGLIVGASAKSSNDESYKYCRANSCNAQGTQLRQDAFDKATAATYAVAIGAAAVAAGVGIWFWSKPTQSVSMGPWSTSGTVAWGVRVNGAL